MKIHVLGAGWAVPRGNRSKTSIMIKGNHIILFDCGGDVAKGVTRFDVGFDEIDAIFLSHKHLDHLSGLTSLLHATWLMNRKRELPIYSNTECLDVVSKLLELHDLKEKLELELIELNEKGEIDKFDVEFSRMEHQVETHGFRYSDVTYSSDTKPCSNLIELAKQSKLLLHEATYPSGREEEARENGHSTVMDAKNVFRKTGSDNLGIIHASPEVNINEEGNRVGENVFFPSDFTTYKFD